MSENLVVEPIAYLMCRSCKTGVEAEDTGYAHTSVGYCAACTLLTDDDRCWSCGRFAKTLRPEHGFCPECLFAHDDDPMHAALERWENCVTCRNCTECPTEGDLTVLRLEDAQRCRAEPCHWNEGEE